MKKLPIEVDHSKECSQLGEVDWWWHVDDCLGSVVHRMQSFSVDSVAQVYDVLCHEGTFFSFQAHSGCL